MPIKPYIAEDEVLKLEILVKEKNDGLDTLLKEAHVHFELNKIPTAKFTFIASNRDIDKKETFPSDSLKENDEITFNVTIKKEKKTLFKGVIKATEKVQDGNFINMKIECKDISYEMTLPSTEPETNNQTFEDKLKLFTKKLKLNDELSGKDWGKEKITHNPATLPWDFVLGYLDSVGVFVSINNGAFNGVDLLKTPPTEKYYAENGINVFSFTGKSDETKKLKKAIIEHWDAATQKNIKTEKEQEAINPYQKLIKLNELRIGPATVDRMLLAILKKSELQTINGKILTFGNLEAHTGDFIKCGNVNEKIDNKPIIISALEHTIENGCWKTEYTLGFEGEPSFAENASKQSPSPQAQIGQINAVSGLQIGVVVQIDEDPNNEFRIKVRIPALSEKGEGIWARLATLNASKEMGSYFIPSVDDEVILGCLGNNPDTPIILGSLYSSAKAMPFPVKKENYTKGFVTKEGTKIILDDEKKSIELSTKKGNKLLISDDEKGFVLEDENKNKITMNQDGITIESSKDFIVKASGDVKIDGIGCNVSASGNMELKGGIIKIN
ncbi:phage baseplate assembly protein V [Flavobacterium aquiphilum]|uniref:phage baseplate assembly protein V n=1 Tax=Flavobacterium aquiphilum TaxID=3003261 RepID=UPI002481733A|nr:phage baseplate assembly protein V [Flavobacterium aquiphilum]